MATAPDFLINSAFPDQVFSLSVVSVKTAFDSWADRYKIDQTPLGSGGQFFRRLPCLAQLQHTSFVSTGGFGGGEPHRYVIPMQIPAANGTLFDNRLYEMCSSVTVTDANNKRTKRAVTAQNLLNNYLRPGNLIFDPPPRGPGARPASPDTPQTPAEDGGRSTRRRQARSSTGPSAGSATPSADRPAGSRLERKGARARSAQAATPSAAGTEAATAAAASASVSQSLQLGAVSSRPPIEFPSPLNADDYWAALATKVLIFGGGEPYQLLANYPRNHRLAASPQGKYILTSDRLPFTTADNPDMYVDEFVLYDKQRAGLIVGVDKSQGAGTAPAVFVLSIDVAFPYVTKPSKEQKTTTSQIIEARKRSASNFYLVTRRTFTDLAPITASRAWHIWRRAQGLQRLPDYAPLGSEDLPVLDKGVTRRTTGPWRLPTRPVGLGTKFTLLGHQAVLLDNGSGINQKAIVTWQQIPDGFRTALPAFQPGARAEDAPVATSGPGSGSGSASEPDPAETVIIGRGDAPLATPLQPPSGGNRAATTTVGQIRNSSGRGRSIERGSSAQSTRAREPSSRSGTAEAATPNAARDARAARRSQPPTPGPTFHQRGSTPLSRVNVHQAAAPARGTIVNPGQQGAQDKPPAPKAVKPRSQRPTKTAIEFGKQWFKNSTGWTVEEKLTGQARTEWNQLPKEVYDYLVTTRAKDEPESYFKSHGLAYFKNTLKPDGTKGRFNPTPAWQRLQKLSDKQKGARAFYISKLPKNLADYNLVPGTWAFKYREGVTGSSAEAKAPTRLHSAPSVPASSSGRTSATQASQAAAPSSAPSIAAEAAAVVRARQPSAAKQQAGRSRRQAAAPNPAAAQPEAGAAATPPPPTSKQPSSQSESKSSQAYGATTQGFAKEWFERFVQQAPEDKSTTRNGKKKLTSNNDIKAMPHAMFEAAMTADGSEHLFNKALSAKTRRKNTLSETDKEADIEKALNARQGLGAEGAILQRRYVAALPSNPTAFPGYAEAKRELDMFTPPPSSGQRSVPSTDATPDATPEPPRGRKGGGRAVTRQLRARVPPPTTGRATRSTTQTGRPARSSAPATRSSARATRSGKRPRTKG